MRGHSNTSTLYPHVVLSQHSPRPQYVFELRKGSERIVYMFTKDTIADLRKVLDKHVLDEDMPTNASDAFQVLQMIFKHKQNILRS